MGQRIVSLCPSFQKGLIAAYGDSRNVKRRRNRGKEKNKCRRGAKLMYNMNIFLKTGVLEPVFYWPTRTDCKVSRSVERLLSAIGSFVLIMVEAFTPQTSVMPHKSKPFLLTLKSPFNRTHLSAHHRRVKKQLVPSHRVVRAKREVKWGTRLKRFIKKKKPK